MSVTSALHINFRGRAEEALRFYQSVFGGDLTVVRYGDTPSGDGVDRSEQADQVVWGQVQSPGGFHVMAYDVQAERDLDPGVNPYYFALRNTDAEEITRCWQALVEGASVEVDLAPSVFSPLHGKLTDRFGVIWIIDVVAPRAG